MIPPSPHTWIDQRGSLAKCQWMECGVDADWFEMIEVVVVDDEVLVVSIVMCVVLAVEK